MKSKDIETKERIEETILKMADPQGHGQIKMFDGEDEAKYPAWRKWARAKLRVLKLKGLDEAALGSELLTYLVPDSTAWEVIKDIPEAKYECDGGEEVLFQALFCWIVQDLNPHVA